MALTASISGNLVDASGAAIVNGSVTFTLVNFGNGIPSVSGTGIVATPVITVTSGINGAFTTTLYGNDVISVANTYYTVTYEDNLGRLYSTTNYQFTSNGTYDLNSFHSNIYPPAPTPPVLPTSATWSNLQNATSALTLGNAGFGTTFNQTAAVPWTWANTTPATSGNPQNSPVLGLAGTIFNGSVSVADKWTLQNIPDPTVNNGTTALKLLHTGTAGMPMFSVGDVNSLSPTATTFFSNGSPNLFGPMETTMGALQVFGHSQAPDSQALYVVNDYTPLNDTVFGAAVWSFLTNNTGSDSLDAQIGMSVQAIHQGSKSVQTITALSIATESDGTFTTPVPSMTSLEILGNLSPASGPRATNSYGIFLYDQNQAGVSAQNNYGVFFNPQTTTGGTKTWCIYESDNTCLNQFGSSNYLGVVGWSASAGTVAPSAGISQLGAASLAIGNGTAGDFTGALKLGAFIQDNATAATNVLSQSSPIYTLSGRYWTGAASATDSWTVQDVVANGTNGTSTLTFTHSGSSGVAALSIPLVTSPLYIGIVGAGFSVAAGSGGSAFSTAAGSVIKPICQSVSNNTWMLGVNASNQPMFAAPGSSSIIGWCNGGLPTGNPVTTCLSESSSGVLAVGNSGTVGNSGGTVLCNAVTLATNGGSKLQSSSGAGYIMFPNNSIIQFTCGNVVQWTMRGSAFGAATNAVYGWGDNPSDTGISRLAAASIALGNGTQGDFSAALKLGTATLTAAAPTVAAAQVGIGSTTATTANAGANGAPPAQVAGYLIINVAGTAMKVPYYAN
jgi:hypothetical protein